MIIARSRGILVRRVRSFMGLHPGVEVIGLVLEEVGPASLEDVVPIPGLISLVPWIPLILIPLLLPKLLILSWRMLCANCWTADLLLLSVPLPRPLPAQVT